MLDRRDFLKGTAATAGAAALLSGSQIALAEEATPAIPEYSVDEELDADIVIVGGGGSGMAAAIEASELGAKVVLLEKSGALGGNASMTEGIFGVGSPMQAEKGVDIPFSHVIEEEMVYTNFRTWGPLLIKYFGASGGNVQWLMDHGVAFKEVSNYRGISSFDCFHWWEGNRGREAFATIANCTVDAGVDVHLNTEAQDLVFEDGKITGVYALSADDGKQLKVNAKAVILASGGFAADLDRVSQMTWLNVEGCRPSGRNNGAGIKMALSAGCGTTSVCGLYKTTVGGEGVDSKASSIACFQPLLMVNEYGLRFAREDLNITSYSALYFNAVHTQRKCFSLIDKSIIDLFSNGGIMYSFGTMVEGQPVEGLPEAFEASAESGNPNVFRGDTIEELAEAMGVDAEILKDTVERYNSMCEKGEDTDFGKLPQYLVPLVEGPYYALIQIPTVYVTIGGIDVDINNQVVKADGTQIPGLFAAGVDCCKLYKETYNYQLSGGMIGYCIYSGRTAAQSAFATL
ncbi:MAG: FAD-binding protein [Coriobacteriales bacterium]|nr:FAD-binding protein [Coriobacteriales bacterium]